MAQKIVESNSKLQTSLTSTDFFGDTLIFDSSKDIPITALTQDTFGDVMTGLGYLTTDRAYTMVADLFGQNANISLRIAGTDILVSLTTIAEELGILWADKTVPTWNIGLLVQIQEASIIDADTFNAAQRITAIYKVATATTSDLKSFRESLNNTSYLVVSGNDTPITDLKNEDAKVVGFMTTLFPNSGTSYNGIALNGLVDNQFVQADENLLLGTQLGEIDGDGNGGMNLPVSAHGKIVMMHGTATNGKNIGLIHFSNWLDSTLEFEVGRLIIERETAGNAIPVGPEGSDILTSFINQKVLGIAVFYRAILSSDGTQNGNPVGFDFVDASTGLTERASVKVLWDGVTANIQYLLAATVYAKKVKISNTILAGQTEGGE